MKVKGLNQLFPPSLNVRVTERLAALLLLGLAALSLFAFQNHITGFDVGHHGFLSAHGLTLAKSLFTGNHFLMFTQISRQANGQLTYEPYSRFPLFSFLIIGLAIQPFEPHLAWQVYAARQVMNVFFVLSLFVCFKIIKALTGDAFIGLSVTFAAFSSTPLLYYSDMVFNDIPTLWGFLLALLLVVRNQRSTLPLGWLVGISCVSVCLGWQPYTVFGVWCLGDFLKELQAGKITRHTLRAFSRRPAVIALLAALLTGIVILSLQMLNEWTVIRGPLLELPSVHAGLWRLGLAPAPAYNAQPEVLDWGNYFRVQVRNALGMTFPFALVFPVDVTNTLSLALATLVTGALVAGSVLRWKALIRHYPILLTWVLPGVLWAVLFRNFVAFHNFQSIYYIGLPMALFTLLSSYLNSRAAKITAVLFCFLFILNVRNINLIKASGAENLNQMTQEFQAIYDRLPARSTVFIDGERSQLGIGFHAVDFYLIRTYSAPPVIAQYIVSANPFYNPARLTSNAHVNLFLNLIPSPPQDAR